MSVWNTLRELVEGALAQGDSERESWLETECAGDPDLLAEARELIAASLEDEAFLAPAAPSLAHHPVLPEGSRIGPYRLTGVIATGGMGTVYLAERESPTRRVALKVMRAGLGSPASAARFKYEVEVLASLRHPNIAPMYETGVQETKDHRELPWFAMEYVEGSRSITEFARSEGLSRHQRIDLLCAVCEAVHHGHGRGVIHRDLKPDNLLVDEQGVVKVIDFGVARAVDAGPASGTMRTSHGEIVGTLAYMSPEQVSGKPGAIGIQSDVYSLGVVLFELITGQLPYDLAEKGLVSSARTIEEQPPLRAGQVEPSAGGDLETVLS
ncbi:MAG: protein kinase, partial [Candidatus Latescibacteria bacterium]|nr:protein kinase [Candidatus Latescibacterota bacterium]